MGHQIQKTNYTHQALADTIIANPSLTHGQIGEIFGRTKAWVCYVVNSDAFQMYLAKRKEDVVDPVLSMTMEEKFRGLASKSCDILLEKLETTENADVALEVLKVSAKSLGYGARGTQLTINQQNTQQNTYVVALPSQTQNSADWEGKYAGGALSAGSSTPIETQSE